MTLSDLQHAPVIFLDMDGVVNGTATMSMFNASVDPDAVRLLNELVASTGAVVVLSSSWRKYPVGLAHTQQALDEAGASFRLVAQTPDLGVVNATRGIEVRAWREAIGHVGPYVILDDDSDFLAEQRRHFIQTSYEVGFVEGDLLQAQEILRSTRSEQQQPEG